MGVKVRLSISRILLFFFFLPSSFFSSNATMPDSLSISREKVLTHLTGPVLLLISSPFSKWTFFSFPFPLCGRRSTKRLGLWAKYKEEVAKLGMGSAVDLFVLTRFSLSFFLFGTRRSGVTDTSPSSAGVFSASQGLFPSFLLPAARTGAIGRSVRGDGFSLRPGRRSPAATYARTRVVLSFPFPPFPSRNR